MDRSIPQLIRVLQHTETLYIQLLGIIDEERQAAIAADPQRLTSASIEKQGLISQLKPLDRQLTGLIQQIGRQLQIPITELRLSVLAPCAGPPYDRQIRELNSHLQQVIAQVQRANEECRQLVKHCLRLVQNKLGYFYHWMGASDVYAASGNIRGETSGGRLLRGVV